LFNCLKINKYLTKSSIGYIILIFKKEIIFIESSDAFNIKLTKSTIFVMGDKYLRKIEKLILTHDTKLYFNFGI